MYVVGRVNQGIRRAMRVGLRPWGLSVPAVHSTLDSGCPP